jgi:hypothetical protein
MAGAKCVTAETFVGRDAHRVHRRLGDHQAIEGK